MKLWRRSYDVPPPPLAVDAEYSQFHDPRYASLPPEVRPRTECLADVVGACSPTGTTRSCPSCAAAEVLVAAHGNSLRALIKHLDGMARTTSSSSTCRPASRCGTTSTTTCDRYRRRHLPRPGGRRRRHRGRQEPGQAELPLGVGQRRHPDRVQSRTMASKKAYVDHLRNVPLFACCTRKELEKIAKAGDEITMTAGTMIVDQGQTGHEAFVVVEGTVRQAQRQQGRHARTGRDRRRAVAARPRAAHRRRRVRDGLHAARRCRSATSSPCRRGPGAVAQAARHPRRPHPRARPRLLRLIHAGCAVLPGHAVRAWPT